MARVLIVDDCEDMQEALEMMLTDEGFDVSSAPNGKRGLALSRELRPDVILLDMMMPEMDGLEFLTQLAAEPSPPPVIGISGFDRLRAEALRRGAFTFLFKPFSFDILVEAVRSALARRPVRPSLLAENVARVEAARQLALEESAAAVARLGELTDVREALRRVPRWLTIYFGFGVSLVDLLRGNEFSAEATYGSAALALYEGLRVGRDSSYCDEVVAAGSTLLLNDPKRHPAESIAHHKQAVAGVRFYAGVPLTIAHGPAVGALCILDTIPHEFRTEDMRVLEALGRGVSRGLETHSWPIDENGALAREYLDVLLDSAAAREEREDGAAVGMTIEACTPAPEGQGLAVIRLDAHRMVVLWAGKAGAWSPPENVVGHVLSQVEFSGVREHEAASARLRTICA
jgi:CheY-like chemotaxis protein